MEKTAFISFGDVVVNQYQVRAITRISDNSIGIVYLDGSKQVAKIKTTKSIWKAVKDRLKAVSVIGAEVDEFDLDDM